MSNIPLHKYSGYFRKNDFFNGIEDFKSLENKIINQKTPIGLTKELIDGYAMEVFAEAYLNLYLSNIKNVWPQGSVPKHILDKYNIPAKDRGYDGVFEDNENQIHTYQVKFRSKNENLIWGKLSTFDGIGENIKSRVLIYNGNKVDDYFKSKKTTVLFRGLDFDRLKKIDFLKISSWISSESKNFQKKIILKKDKYQTDTTKKVLKEFQNKDRATIILACGLGKTIIGIDVFEKLKPNLIVIFVPSIALIRQTRLDWLEDSKVKFASLAVCSINDRDAKKDEATFNESDFNFKITTKPKEIRTWIKQNQKKPKVIFTTYQSSKKLCEGAKGFNFDLGIFDEAHRTAIINKQLNKKSYFSYSLYEENISIKKRLFMTATRRISKRNRFHREGDKIESLSMDNPNLYGNVVQNISFLEGAKLNVIAKPKVIITTITSKEVNKHLIDKGITTVKGETSKAFQVATQIAIKRAIKDYGIKKIFSFHSSISRSESFTSNKIEGIKTQIPNIVSNHIDGSYKLEDREVILKSFKTSNTGIISNVRCLVEGVNVPEVDAIAFTSPKESLIDVIQAIGRSLRKRQNKKKRYGYVILPVYLDLKKNEKLSKNLEKNNFELIADVINALREHDDEINQIIEKAIINQKKHKGFGFSSRKDDFDELIETKSEFIDLKILKNTIKTKLLQKLTTKWEEMLGELILYKSKFGDFKIRKNEEQFDVLFKWMNAVKRRIRDGSLANYKLVQLKKINFPLQFDDEQIAQNKYKFYLSVWNFYRHFDIRPPSKHIAHNYHYIKAFCKEYNIKLYNGYGLHKKLKGQVILKSEYLKIDDLKKTLKKNKIIFKEDIKEISNKDKLFSRNDTCKFLNIKKKYSSSFLRKLINSKQLKIAYFIFGSKFKKNHGLNDFKNKSICYEYLFYKKDIKNLKEKFKVINSSKEIDLNTISEKYNISLRNYSNYKFNFFKRRKKDSLELVDCILITEFKVFLKKYLKINLNKKIIIEKKLTNLDGIKLILKNLGYNKESTPTVLSKLKKIGVIKFAGNYFSSNEKRKQENSRRVEKFFFSDFEEDLRKNLIEKYKIKMKGYDISKPLIINNTKSYLESKGIYTDNDLIKILKIDTGDKKNDQSLIRSLRNFYGLTSECYIRQMGLPAHGTSKKVLLKFIDNCGCFFTYKHSNLISHKILSKKYKTLNFYDMVKGGKIKSKFFYIKPGEGNLTFLISREEIISALKKHYFKKDVTSNFDEKLNKAILETEEYLSNISN